MGPHAPQKRRQPQPYSSFPGNGQKFPKEGHKLASLLLHSNDIFTYINTFLEFEESLVDLTVCKRLRRNWFMYTSILSVQGKRSFGDVELAYFLLNMENLRAIDLTQCQKIEHFPQRQKNNIHPNLVSVKLASTSISLPSLKSYFGQLVSLSSFPKLQVIDIRGTPSLAQFCHDTLDMDVKLSTFHHALSSLANMHILLSYIKSKIEIFRHDDHREKNCDAFNNLLLSSLSNYDGPQEFVGDADSLNHIAKTILLHLPVLTSGGSTHHPEHQLILTAASANAYVPDIVLRELLKLGAGVNFIAGDHNYYSPLMSACQNGASSSKLRLLLNHGANILFPCHNNEHALHFAIDGSSKKRVTKILLRYLLRDAAGNKQLEYERINQKENVTGWTYIMRATFEGSLGSIEAMLQFNASCDIKDNADRTIIHLAAKNTNPQILNLLVKKCDLDYNSSTCGTALHVACRHLNLTNVRILLNHGASVHLKFQGMTPAEELRSKVKGYLTRGAIKRQILHLLDNYEPPVTSISPWRKKRRGRRGLRVDRKDVTHLRANNNPGQ